MTSLMDPGRRRMRTSSLSLANFNNVDIGNADTYTVAMRIAAYAFLDLCLGLESLKLDCDDCNACNCGLQTRRDEVWIAPFAGASRAGRRGNYDAAPSPRC